MTFGNTRVRGMLIVYLVPTLVFHHVYGSTLYGDWVQQTKSSCAYRCNNFYSLACPLGEKLGIRQLNYGAKPDSLHCPADSLCYEHSRCCSYEHGDCLQEFSDHDMYPIYKECSGKQQCGWLKAPSIDVKNVCQFRKMSNFMMARFDCIKEKDFIDICSDDSITAKVAHLVYDGHEFRHPRPASWCTCNVVSKSCNQSHKLEFFTIDVRLNRIEHNISKCSSASRLDISDTSHGHRVSCIPNSFHHGFTGVYTTSSPDSRVALLNEPGKYPSYVWVGVKVNSDEEVVVSCGKSSRDNPSRCSPIQIIHTPSTPRSQNNRRPMRPMRPNRNENTDRKDMDVYAEKPPPSSGTEEDSDLAVIIGGTFAGLVVLVLGLLLLVVILRRRKQCRRENTKVHSSLLIVATCFEDKEEPNYYEVVDVRNGKHIDVKPDNVHVTPASIPKPNSRAKPEDLAYATSEEIGVLIKKMERDRHLINEGCSPDPKFYRNIDDYNYNTDDIYETVNNNKDVEEGNNKNSCSKTDISDSGLSDTSVNSPKSSDADTNGQISSEVEPKTPDVSDSLSQSDNPASLGPGDVSDSLNQSDIPASPKPDDVTDFQNQSNLREHIYEEVYDVVKHEGRQKVTTALPEVEESITKF